MLFADGTEEPVDVIVYSTGFDLSFPFIDNALLNWRNGRPDLCHVQAAGGVTAATAAPIVD